MNKDIHYCSCMYVCVRFWTDNAAVAVSTIKSRIFFLLFFYHARTGISIVGHTKIENDVVQARIGQLLRFKVLNILVNLLEVSEALVTPYEARSWCSTNLPFPHRDIRWFSRKNSPHGCFCYINKGFVRYYPLSGQIFSIILWLYSSFRMLKTCCLSLYQLAGTFLFILVRSRTFASHFNFVASKLCTGSSSASVGGGWLIKKSLMSGLLRSKSRITQVKSDCCWNPAVCSHPRLMNAWVVFSWGKMFHIVAFKSPSNALVLFPLPH